MKVWLLHSSGTASHKGEMIVFFFSFSILLLYIYFICESFFALQLNIIVSNSLFNSDFRISSVYFFSLFFSYSLLLLLLLLWKKLCTYTPRRTTPLNAAPCYGSWIFPQYEQFVILSFIALDGPPLRLIHRWEPE